MTKEELKLESKNITIGFDAAKLDALEFVLRKQRSSVQRRMEEVLQQLYESEVPEAVREYVDSKSAPAARPRRPAKASVTKQKEGDEHAQHEEIVLWLDRRWKNAIEKHLKGETLQEHLETVLDELCNQLPQREYERISREIYAEDAANREAEEAARTYAAYHVMENGKEWYYKTTPGEELLGAARMLRKYLKDTERSTGKFISLYSQAQPITPEEYRHLMHLRMENTGKVTGVFDLNFDKREFSAVHTIEGWKTWAMQDVATGVYRAAQKQLVSGDVMLQKLLECLNGKGITSAGHLSARNFSFGEEIIESDGKLNFYLQADFDVDAAFGTFVCTDQNDDWLNIYANYDIEKDRLCDTLELNLCKGDGTEENWSYHLNAAEQEVLARKMEDYCQQQTGMSLHEYARQLRESGSQTPEMQM